MHPVNILRIFAFSLVLRHSNSNNTFFNSLRVFWDTLYSSVQGVSKKCTPFQIQIIQVCIRYKMGQLTAEQQIFKS